MKKTLSSLIIFSVLFLSLSPAFAETNNSVIKIGDRISGKVVSINGNIITMQAQGRKLNTGSATTTATYAVDASNAKITKGVSANSQTILISDIQVNSTIAVSGSISGSSIPAVSIVVIQPTVNVKNQSQEAITRQLATMRDKANKEIDNRINSLNQLSSRIGQLKKISDSDKSSLQTAIQSVISDLTNLKSKIASDTDAQTLKTDLQSITKAYRVYALVMPRAQIMAAADRIGNVADMLTTVLQKLQTRISGLPAGTATSSFQAIISDITVKIADAKSQAQAAVSGVSNLVPDNGDQNIMKSNTAALKDARSKIQAAQKDVTMAQKGEKTLTQAIRKSLKNNNLKNENHSTSTKSGENQ